MLGSGCPPPLQPAPDPPPPSQTQPPPPAPALKLAGKWEGVGVWPVATPPPCVLRKGAYWRRTWFLLFDDATDEDSHTRKPRCARLSCNRVCVCVCARVCSWVAALSNEFHHGTPHGTFVVVVVDEQILTGTAALLLCPLHMHTHTRVCVCRGVCGKFARIFFRPPPPLLPGYPPKIKLAPPVGIFFRKEDLRVTFTLLHCAP